MILEDERQRVIESGVSLGVKITDCHVSMMLAHLDAVLQANARLNLTAITDREEAIRLHIVDSIAVCSYIGPLPGMIADIGSGAGFPGIPVAIVMSRPVDMIESVKKKAAFISDCLNQLGGLHGSGVHALRAEEVAGVSEGDYQYVIARALTSLPALVELASPMLALGGTLLAMKGAPTNGELDAGSRAAALVGMAETGRHEYRLPLSDERRTIVTYKKISQPEIALPRRVGLAQKRPLS